MRIKGSNAPESWQMKILPAQLSLRTSRYCKRQNQQDGKHLLHLNSPHKWFHRIRNTNLRRVAPQVWNFLAKWIDLRILAVLCFPFGLVLVLGVFWARGIGGCVFCRIRLFRVCLRLRWLRRCRLWGCGFRVRRPSIRGRWKQSLGLRIGSRRGRIFSISLAFFFPMALAKFGLGSIFAFYSVCTLISLFFFIKFLVETKEKSLEDLEKILLKTGK